MWLEYEVAGQTMGQWNHQICQRMKKKELPGKKTYRVTNVLPGVRMDRWWSEFMDTLLLPSILGSWWRYSRWSELTFPVLPSTTRWSAEVEEVKWDLYRKPAIYFLGRLLNSPTISSSVKQYLPYRIL